MRNIKENDQRLVTFDWCTDYSKKKSTTETILCKTSKYKLWITSNTLETNYQNRKNKYSKRSKETINTIGKLELKQSCQNDYKIK